MCRLCEINDAVARPETSRRRFLQFAGGIAAGLAFGAGGLCERDKAAAEAAERDLAGGRARSADERQRALCRRASRAGTISPMNGKRLAGGQNPFATILSCADFPHRARIRLRQRPRRSVRLPGCRQFRQ